jgi:tRNA1(Val) A37 N6-methylase TrmN6
MVDQKIISLIEKQIESFENKKLLEKNKNYNLGIIYTPTQVVDYMVSNIIKRYFHEIFNSFNKYPSKFNLEELYNKLKRNPKVTEKFSKTIKNIRILDPSCGSGRFLISIAEKLFQIYKKIEPELTNFEIKKAIIEKNLYGIEIENSALLISKLRLIKWLFSTYPKKLISNEINIQKLKIKNINQFIEKLNIDFNFFNLDFLLQFNSDKFDIIIGNPPYVENKKIKDHEFKNKLIKKYKTAYRLFDLSILFIERSLELLDNEGYLSLILPNKFLSADYGIKIRLLILDESEIKEIINISSLPIFKNAATYPIILSLKKAKKSKGNEVLIKKFNNLIDLINNNTNEVKKFDQDIINKFPSKVIPLSGNIELITYLFKKFKNFAETFKELKIIYRPFGFLKYTKHFDNISDDPQSDNDLLLIGTGNIGKYYVKFDKRIRITGKDIKISYFKYNSNFENIWRDLNSEKLIFREIAKDLTCCYDPGVFTNITGLYFIRIASFNTDQYFGLLSILNSNFMDSIFKTLFSTLHMSGGYLRFNGSFIKRLPMPRKIPVFLSQLGKILHLLSQLIYDFTSSRFENVKNPELEKLKTKYHDEINIYLNFFTKLNNSLVKLLFLDDLYLESNLDYCFLRNLLELKIELIQNPFRFFIPDFDLKKYHVYSLNELESILSGIIKLYTPLHNNIDLLNQVDDIIKNNFS